jgi:VWFA-related protein
VVVFYTSTIVAVFVLAVLQTAQIPPFRSSIDLVQVDVSAVDANGRPIRDLTAEEFDLRVDGKPRRIVSAQFIVAPNAEMPAAPSPAAAYYSSNAGTSGGRLIMIVVDRGSITPGRGKSVMEAASRFVTRLNPADRVALASIPRGPQVDFTTDHRLVQRLLQQTDGMAPASVGVRNVGIADALSFERKDAFAMGRIYERECGLPSSAGQRGAGASEVVGCYSQMKSEAEQIAADARQKARDSIAGLKALLDRLPPSSTPKVLVFISEGLVTANESSQLAWLEAKAAASHVTLYALHLQASDYDAARRRPAVTYSEDRAVLEEGLYYLTGVTRGDVFRVLSNSDFAFQRLAFELSGYYLLGFEPEVSERDARSHEIQVSVRRGGASVRSRRQFTIGPTVTKTVAADITALLRDPLPASEIPIKVTTYAFREPHTERIRLLIVADIEQAASAAGELSLGYVLVDFDRRLAASQLDAKLPQTAQRVGLTQRYFSGAVIDRGRYTLKMAAVDDAGRRGTVERVVRAQLNAVGRFQITDLLIADSAGPDGNFPPSPTVDGDFTGGTLHAYLELFADFPEALDAASVSLEVAATEGSNALQRAPATLRTPTDDAGCRIAGASVNIAELPAGNYVARAVISIGTRRVGHVTRPFRIGASAAGK